MNGRLRFPLLLHSSAVWSDDSTLKRTACRGCIVQLKSNVCIELASERMSKWVDDCQHTVVRIVRAIDSARKVVKWNVQYWRVQHQLQCVPVCVNARKYNYNVSINLFDSERKAMYCLLWVWVSLFDWCLVAGGDMIDHARQGSSILIHAWDMVSRWTFEDHIEDVTNVSGHFRLVWRYNYRCVKKYDITISIWRSWRHGSWK